ERRNSAASATEREELIAQDDRIDTRLARGLIGDPVAWANEYFDVRAARWIARLPPIQERTDHGGLEDERWHDTRGQDSSDHRCEPRHRRRAGRRGTAAWRVARLCRDAPADSPHR